ncbi:DVU0298 family protein [Chloroflexota bacterium]
MRTSIKPIVKNLLLKRDYAEIIRLCQTDKGYWHTLRLFLYETDENVRWPAIETIVLVMDKWWRDGSKERVREYIRRQLWLLNEESGSMGWSVPEVTAETIIHIPELLEPYGIIMVTHALHGKALLNGSLWAIGRLGKQIREAVVFSQDEILATFNTNNPNTLGLAAWAMGEVCFTPALSYIEIHKDRKEIVQIYIASDFQEKSLGMWSREAIDKIVHEG